MTNRPTVAERIGPVEFGTLGSMVAVRCPREFDPIMRRAGGLWEEEGPAIVAGILSLPDTTGWDAAMVTPPDIEARILRLYHAEKWLIGTIAQQLHVHYSVVGRVLAQAGLPRPGPPPRREE